MARLYADEHAPAELVDLLRQLGHDVATVAEMGLSGGDDAQVLADATREHRIVLTFNRWDFERLHRQNSYHEGIASCSADDDLDTLCQRIDQALRAAGTLARKHIRVNKPDAP